MPLARYRLYHRLATALANGEYVSWSDVQRQFCPVGDRGIVAQLRNIHLLTAASRPDRYQAHTPSDRHDVGISAVVGGASVYTLVALGLGLLGRIASGRFFFVQVGLAVAFLTVAGLLRSAASRDERAKWLMRTYALVASAFATPILRASDWSAVAALGFSGFYPEALVPLALWRFVSVFPRTERFTLLDRLTRAAIYGAGISSVTLFVVNVALAWLPAFTTSSLATLGRDATSQRYWDVIYLTILPALAVVPSRAVAAGAEERARSLVFTLGLGLGFAPLIVKGILQQLVPGFAIATSTGWARTVVDGVVLSALLAVPVVTAYAVRTHQVLTFGAIVTRSTRYALARRTVGIACPLSLAVVGWQLYAHRELTISAVLAMTEGQLAFGFAAACLLLATVRVKALQLVDRLFEHRGGNLQTAVRQCAEALTSARGASEASAILSSHLAAAFGVERIGLLRLTGATLQPTFGHIPSLTRESALYSIVCESLRPVVLTSEAPWVPLLPSAETRWIQIGGAAVMVPLRRPDGEVSCLVVLGPKSSRLPWSVDDLECTSAMCHAAALALTSLTEDDAKSAAIASFVAECSNCGRVSSGERGAHCECGGDWQPGILPAIVAGKFEVQQRVGRGGMGVVYRAHDRMLGRAVALKTLPHVQAAALQRLRDEAQWMGRLSSAHLGVVFGLEEVRNVPVIVMEFFPGGTLQTQLRRATLDRAALVRLAESIGEALRVIHQAGLVHGDVKPSNIGITTAGDFKLLDFGLVRALEPPSDTRGRRLETRATPDHFVGTLAYLSPEVVRGESHTATSDLWALSLVLFESWFGTHPFAQRTASATVRAIGDASCAFERVPLEAPASVARFFKATLAPDSRSRPQTADEWLRRFRRIHTE